MTPTNIIKKTIILSYISYDELFKLIANARGTDFLHEVQILPKKEHFCSFKTLGICPQ